MGKKKIKANTKKKTKNSAKRLKSSDEDRKVMEFLGLDSKYISRGELSQVTYYVSVKTLSEAIGKLPLKLYKRTNKGIIKPKMTDTWRLLSLRPNPYMTATTFWTLCEYWCQHYGNAYVWIDEDMIEVKGRLKHIVKGFYPMSPENVQIWVDDKGLWGTEGCIYYEYTNPDTGDDKILRDHEVLHFKNWITRNGIEGLSVKEILHETISGASAASEYENNLYQNGMMAKMVVQYSGNLSDPLTNEVKERFLSQLQGPKAAGKVIPIPTQFQLIPLSQSLVDSEFSVLKKYTALQICSCFGVKPSQINDYEHSKYNSSEAESLAFLTGTLAYRIKMYEDEINCKVLTQDEYRAGYYYKFNERALLRVSMKEQAEILCLETGNGVISHNEARDNLDLPNMEGADRLLVNGAYVPVEQAGIAYQKSGGEGK